MKPLPHCLPVHTTTISEVIVLHSQGWVHNSFALGAPAAKQALIPGTTNNHLCCFVVYQMLTPVQHRLVEHAVVPLVQAAGVLPQRLAGGSCAMAICASRCQQACCVVQPF